MCFSYIFKWVHSIQGYKYGGKPMNNDLSKELDKTLDLIFGEDPGKLLRNIRTHLENEHLHPVSLNIVKEHNNFCAVVVGETFR